MRGQVTLQSALSHLYVLIPVLDDLPLVDEATTIALPDNGGARVTTPFEIPLTRDVLGYEGAVISRAALRGTWLSFVIDTPDGLAAGDLILEAISVEYEVERESRESVA